MRAGHVRADTGDEREFKELVDTARELGRPKALYEACFIDARGPETVTISGITFTSPVLRRNLEKAERVFAFVATCGHELDEVRLPAGDYLKGFWWDAIKASLLRSAREHLERELAQRFALGKTAVMNPGSGDANVWPIEQQKELFSLLGDVRGQIGVRLTDSFLMVPNKTVSGVRFPTEVDFRSCQLCHRPGCPSRGAAFDRQLWESMEHA
jgi:hypothetical protein